MIVYCTRPDMNLDYTIKYSARRRKLTITIERDRSIMVNAPKGTSPAKIQEIVESKNSGFLKKQGMRKNILHCRTLPVKNWLPGNQCLILAGTIE